MGFVTPTQSDKVSSEMNSYTSGLGLFLNKKKVLNEKNRRKRQSVGVYF